MVALRSHSRRTSRRRRRPARHRPQLYRVDHGRVHLPVVHETLPLPVVDAIQLSSFDRPRLWRRLRHRRHLLYLAATERRHQSQLVGQYGVAADRRCADGSAQGPCTGSDFWAKLMVVTPLPTYECDVLCF